MWARGAVLGELLPELVARERFLHRARAAYGALLAAQALTHRSNHLVTTDKLNSPDPARGED